MKPVGVGVQSTEYLSGNIEAHAVFDVGSAKRIGPIECQHGITDVVHQTFLTNKAHMLKMSL